MIALRRGENCDKPASMLYLKSFIFYVVLHSSSHDLMGQMNMTQHVAACLQRLENMALPGTLPVMFIMVTTPGIL